MKELRLKFLQTTKVVLIVAMVISIALLVLYVSLFNKIKAGNIETAVRLQQAEEALEQFYKVNDQKKSVEETIEERAQLDTYFLTQDNVAGFFEKLEQLAESAGVEFTITSARLAEKEEEGLQMLLTAQGTFSQVYQFFLLLETAPVGLNFSRVDIKKGGVTAEDSGTWQGTFDIKIITYKTAL